MRNGILRKASLCLVVLLVLAMIPFVGMRSQAMANTTVANKVNSVDCINYVDLGLLYGGIYVLVGLNYDDIDTMEFYVKGPKDTDYTSFDY